ncbi:MULTISPECIES: substrate-binding domain-containing protein [unclassified Curtobacterium]|uniref:substrate-binding domain-containing protein n=1 Tax=unclassified Curtobacterium TaxID=257496 RepID=UPI0007D7361D|nr:substrate-binding domain-containing protein [Curtobacterium sp. 9128]SBN62389.1 simple sugar transport system substrate-binding protein [Curtobacterium sp. 9128]
MKRISAVMGITVAVAASALVLAGCSSQGGRVASSGDDSAGGTSKDSGLTIALVTHAAPGDTFWDIVRKGAEDAAKKDGVKLLYASDPDGSKQAQLVQQYTDQKVDGIAVSLAKPDALKSSVQAAEKAGIPVVSFNSGSDAYSALGILAHFGQDESVAGEAVGNELKKQGLAKPICVIQEQGNVALEARCGGIKKVLPDTQTLYVNGTDNSAVQSTVTAKLQADSDADVIVGLGAPYTAVILKAVKAAGSDIKVASFDLNATLAKSIKSGDVLFTVDQQPFMQGYESIDSIVLYKQGGFVLGGGKPTLTGPAIVDKSNIGKVLQYAEDGLR